MAPEVCMISVYQGIHVNPKAYTSKKAVLFKSVGPVDTIQLFAILLNQINYDPSLDSNDCGSIICPTYSA